MLRTKYDRVAHGPAVIIIINIGTAGSERLHIERGAYRTDSIVWTAHRTTCRFSRYCAIVRATRRCAFTKMDSERRQEHIVSNEKRAIIELLELYKDFPCLWNTTHSLYCNKDARNQAFEILLEKWKTYYPVATITDIKKKIEHLRAAYRRERNKVRNKIKQIFLLLLFIG